MPPMGKISIPVKVRITSKILAKLRLGGSFEGKSVLPVCMQLKPADAQIDSSLKARTLSVADPERWSRNSSGDMNISKDPIENAVRFDITFRPNTDHWAYPSFAVKLPEERLAGAVGVSFDIKSQLTGQSGFGARLLMIGMDEKLEGGVNHYFSYTPKDEWQTVYVSFDSDAPVVFNPGNIRRLAIGANPIANNYVYWLKNIKAYYK